MNHQFITLTPSHTNQVHSLLNDNYQTSTDSPIKIRYSRDFIYWLLRQNAESLNIGICFGKKLCGVILCPVFPSIVNGETVNVPYPLFLCVKLELRGLGLAKKLVDELKQRFAQKSYTTAIVSTKKEMGEAVASYNSILIPINFTKLVSVGFLSYDSSYVDYSVKTNPLTLLKSSHIKEVASILNESMKDYQTKPLFDSKTVHQMFLPKKNIVYSYVKLNENGEATDFISAYVFTMETGDNVVQTASLSFAVANTIDISTLMLLFVCKLARQGVDQLVYQDLWGDKIHNIIRFTTADNIKYALFGGKSDTLIFYSF